MDILRDDDVLDIFQRLSPQELIKLRVTSVRVKELAEITLRGLKKIVIEYRGFVPLFNREGASHLVNGEPLDVKDEFQFCTRLLNFCRNTKDLRFKIKEHKSESFEKLCTTICESQIPIEKFSFCGDRFNIKYENTQMERIAQAAPSIKKASFGEGVTEEDLTSFLTCANNLSSFELRLSSEKLTGTCLAQIGDNVKQLIIRGAVYWFEVSSLLIRNLVESRNERNGLEVLKFKCKGIKQEYINQITKQKAFESLKILAFLRPEHHNAEVRLIDLTPIQMMKNLESLHLEVFTFVDDDAVLRILTACTKITRFVLRVPNSNFHSLVTDISMIKVPKLAPQLRELSLQNVRIGDNALVNLGNLPGLLQLTLENVDINGPQPLQRLLSKSRALEKLNIKQCFNVSKNQLVSTLEEIICTVRQSALKSVRIHQETIFDPPPFRNLPRQMSVCVVKMRY